MTLILRPTPITNFPAKDIAGTELTRHETSLS